MWIVPHLLFSIWLHEMCSQKIIENRNHLLKRAARMLYSQSRQNTIGGIDGHSNPNSRIFVAYPLNSIHRGWTYTKTHVPVSPFGFLLSPRDSQLFVFSSLSGELINWHSGCQHSGTLHEFRGVTRAAVHLFRASYWVRRGVRGAEIATLHCMWYVSSVSKLRRERACILYPHHLHWKAMRSYG